MTRMIQENINRMLRWIALLVWIPCLVAALSGATLAQSAPIWTGSISCQLNDVEQGVYQRQEVQTWTLTGAPRDPSQAMPVYPATWTAQAQGQLLRQQGTQATSIQWMANVAGGQTPPVGLAITVRASDGRLMIKQYTVSQSAPNAIIGRRQLFVNGVSQGQPATFGRALQQWQFPLIEANPTDDPVTGSVQIQADAGSAELVHRFGGSGPVATCQWRFTKGGAGGQTSGQGAMDTGMPNPNQPTLSGNPGAQVNAQNCESPATVQQSFETMKADLQTQYDKLIQGTTNPNEIASLKNQEQRMIATLNSQEQRDMALASQGCLQPGNSGGNAAGGASATGSNSGAAGGAAAGAGASGSAGSSSGGAANGSAAGAANNSGAAGSTNGANSGTTSAGGAPSSGAAATANGRSGSAAGGSAAGAGPSSGSGSGSGTNTSAGGAASGTAGAAGNTSGSAGAGTGATGSTGSAGSSGSNGLPVAISPTHVASMGLLTGVSPATNSGQQNVTVTLTGQLTNFVNGATTVTFTRTSQPSPSVSVNAAVLKNLSPSGPPPVQVGTVKVNSKISATVTLSMNPSTAAGTYTITATTPTSSGTPEVVTLNNAFTVTPTVNLTATTLTPTPATLNVSPASGSYLVTVTSLRCGKPTLDDPLQMDGKGDEIYASAFVRHYDRRNSQLLDLVYPTTQIYGDANQSTRLQSGTRSNLGGIQGKDIIPDYPSDAPVDRANIPAKSDMFPLKLWQGTMTDGVDVLVVSPSIWESDRNLTLFNRWVQNQINLNQTLISAKPVQDQISNKQFGYFKLGNVSEGTTNISTNSWETAGILALDAIFAIPSVDLPVNTAMDRPIGLAPNDMNSSALPNTTVVLTREIIEAALNGPSTTVYPYFVPNVMATPQIITVPKPGIMVIVFTDTAAVTGNVPILLGDGPASYAMILQVERM